MGGGGGGGSSSTELRKGQSAEKEKRKKLAGGGEQVWCEMGFPSSLCGVCVCVCLFAYLFGQTRMCTSLGEVGGGGKQTDSEGLIVPMETKHEQRF